MKVLVVPDIHLKLSMFDLAEIAVESDNYDRIVFLGDFCDDWGKERNLGLYEDTFAILDKFLTDHSNSLVCWGNHDVSYFWHKFESGYSSISEITVIRCLKDVQTKHQDKFKFVHMLDNVIFSHGGITQDFVLKYFGKNPGDIDNIVNTINTMGDRQLWDNCSPIWARPGYHFYSSGLLQVVGHTPVEIPTMYLEENMLVYDTFSTYRDGCPVGDQKLIWVDTIEKTWEYVKLDDRVC